MKTTIKPKSAIQASRSLTANDIDTLSILYKDCAEISGKALSEIASLRLENKDYLRDFELLDDFKEIASRLRKVMEDFLTRQYSIEDSLPGQEITKYNW